MNLAIGRRYAKALFELAREDGSLDASRVSLEQLSEILAHHQDLKNVCSNPIFSREDRKQALEQVLGRLGAPPVIRRFLDILIAKHRLPYLPETVRAFAAMVDEEQGRQAVLVRVAKELKAKDQALLKSRLEVALGKQVALTIEAEPALIAGMVIQMGSEVFDGSVRGQLDMLRRTLTART